MAITGHVTKEMVSHYSMVRADEKMSVASKVADLIGVSAAKERPNGPGN